MRSHRSQGQIVVNFFTLATIIMVTVVLTLYVKYGPKEKYIHSNLQCQKLTYTYDKISDSKQIGKANELLNHGAYMLDGGFIKPRFGKSYLRHEITVHEANKFFELAVLKEPIERNIFVKIKYEIIEKRKERKEKRKDEK